MVQETVEEEIRIRPSQDSLQSSSLPRFVAREAGDVVFHVHPTTEAESSEAEDFPTLIDDLGTLNAQEARIGFHVLPFDKIRVSGLGR